MTTFMDEVAAAAIELARGARWDRALALLDAAAAEAGTARLSAEGDAGAGRPSQAGAAGAGDTERARPSEAGDAPAGAAGAGDGRVRGRLALAAAAVAVDRDWWAGTDTAAERLEKAERAGAGGWQLDFLRLRRDYLRLIHPVGGTFQPGPWGKDPEVIADVERRAGQLRRTASGTADAGWAEMYLGLVADNLRADREAAPGHYEAALAAADRDDLLAREALRHLGDHDHDNGDRASALERWQRATALGAGAGYVTGTLSQQLLLAVLARDAGDEAAATALASEVARWAEALGAAHVRDNANGFLSGADPTAAPEEAAGETAAAVREGAAVPRSAAAPEGAREERPVPGGGPVR